MWTIANTTPYAVEAQLLRDASGAETLAVVTKGSFVIRADGQCCPDCEQTPIVQVPQYAGVPACSSLLRDTDFVLHKPTTDVLVSGHAYAGAPRRTSTMVTMEVGPIAKRLRVWGDRHWERSALRWSASAPLPFERVPLLYERAFGGSAGAARADGIWSCDPRNPIGRGFKAAELRREGDPLPNIEPEDGRQAPAGLGAISRHWSPRVELAGTHNEAWRSKRFPLPPEDFDPRFYNAAPSDQQPRQHLIGGEPAYLENLTPDGSLRFVIPKVWLTLNTTIGLDVEGHRAQLHTLVLVPDERRVEMTWVSTLRCHGRATRIRRIHVREKPRVGLGAQMRRRAGA
ncbi:DUF2169 family type VI secretion system accessory protein [Pseudorhodoferax sp.]|uniref:DUF2169 family type VI secretion system accessory protein n=1 Tax=Pseudorhodoferax sp. TaxID=1993553 RepID=UPI0039E283FF